MDPAQRDIKPYMPKSEKAYLSITEKPLISGKLKKPTVRLHPHPDPQYAISKLAQLSIKRLTKLYTHHAIETKPPNCEADWQSHIRGPPITVFIHSTIRS